MSYSLQVTKQSLHESQRGLLAVFQRVRYGRLPRLRVRGGLPDLAGGVHAVQTVKVRGDNDAHPAAAAGDFALRAEVVEFFRLLEGLGEGEVTDVEIRDGLPFMFKVDRLMTA